jgi:hypothetical protein
MEETNMARIKYDGVIEAVRYTPEGMISLIRTYERRGAVWSDHILLDRSELIARLADGKHFVVGRRKVFLGSVFETGEPVHYKGEHIFSGGQPATRDLLAGVSIF